MSILSKCNFLFVFLAMLMLSCNGGKQTVDIEDLVRMDSVDSANDTLHLFEAEEVVEVPKAVDELFDDFFFKFASEVRFQMYRVNFPLVCKEGDVEIILEREDWEQYNKFGQQEYYSVIYDRDDDFEVQKDTAVSRVSVSWIYLNEEYVESFRFARREGKWRLTSVDKKFLDDVPNGEFLSFYSQFATDSLYQVESIDFPLKMEYENDGGDIEEEDMMLTPEKWQEMRAELPIPAECLVTIDYGQPHYSQKKKILLMEGASSGLFMYFKFNKIGDDWKLVEIEC